MANQQRLVALIVAALGYVVKYIAYNFLTPVVLMTFAAVMFAYLTYVGSELPFFNYYSFLLPIDETGRAHLDENDIMRFFNILTVLFFLFSIIVGWVWQLLRQAKKRIFASELEADGTASVSPTLFSSLKRRFIINSIVISAVYLAVFAGIPFAKMENETSPFSGYLVFIVFYIIALVSNAIFVGVDSLSNLMLGWAWPRVLYVQESV